MGKVLNYFYVFFVVVLIAMIVFFSRLVSIMLTQKKNAELTKANAAQTTGTKTYLEDTYTMTVRLTQLAELQSSRGGAVTPEQKEIMVTLAEGRRQAMLAVIEENPQAVRATVFSEELRMALPEEARTFIERKGTVEGVIKSVNSSGGENQKEVTHNTVTTLNGNRYIMYFTQSVEVPKPGSRAIIQGIILDDRIIVESVKLI